MDIKDVLIAERIKRGIKQNEMADFIGISSTALCRFESGRNKELRFRNMQKYAEKLGMEFVLMIKSN